jgi:hypothetical protein
MRDSCSWPLTAKGFRRNPIQVTTLASQLFPIFRQPANVGNVCFIRPALLDRRRSFRSLPAIPQPDPDRGEYYVAPGALLGASCNCLDSRKGVQRPSARLTVIDSCLAMPLGLVSPVPGQPEFRGSVLSQVVSQRFRTLSPRIAKCRESRTGEHTRLRVGGLRNRPR